MNSGGFVPQWPVPSRVRGFITERTGGVSPLPYTSNNIAGHVGDDPNAVADNRSKLQIQLGLPRAPQWLNQIHGDNIVELGIDSNPAPMADADGAISGDRGVACAVMTADCLPILLCDSGATQVAAIHCGWRGLAKGIITRAIDKFASPAVQIMAYLGPAISAEVYEVGEEVVDAFKGIPATSSDYAVPNPNNPGHFFLDLYQLARIHLRNQGVSAIYGGDCCCYREQDRFYSYRRDGITGRMASLIWLD